MSQTDYSGAPVRRPMALILSILGAMILDLAQPGTFNTVITIASLWVLFDSEADLRSCLVLWGLATVIFSDSPLQSFWREERPGFR